MITYDDEIVSIEYIGQQECIDIEVSDDHLFYANGLLTKNSVGVAATADLIAIFGSGEDKAVYESELFYKIVKNRLGGRVGVVDKFYTDARNLKMYDSSEQDQWVDDAKISNDTRSMAEITTPDPIERNRGHRSGTRRR
jgi:hypothetical protein